MRIFCSVFLQLVKHLYFAVRHNDSEKVDLLLAAGADQNAKVDGTDVTPKEEAKRRKCYLILKQLAAKAPQTEDYEEPDYWDMPTIEDLRLLFKVRFLPFSGCDVRHSICDKQLTKSKN